MADLDSNECAMVYSPLFLWVPFVISLCGMRRLLGLPSAGLTPAERQLAIAPPLRGAAPRDGFAAAVSLVPRTCSSALG